MLRAAQPSLKWVQSGQAGQDAAPLALYKSKDVVLTNAAVITGSHLAEHILAFMLAFSRQLPLHFANQQSSKWVERSEYPSGELTGSTILVVGLGGAGRGTCQRAKAFNMTVIATRRRPDASSGKLPDGVDEIHGGDKDSLLAVLPRADYVAVCCPLTPETRNLFSKDAFAAMKPSSIIMSVGRGPIINTADLVDALQSGQIAGAGLDVTDPQPLPPDHPLWHMKNVIITPHASGHSPLRAGRMQELVVDNLRRFISGGTANLRNQVDTTAGY
jgi:phosphoglycerate dehydrogenase-like enzyme